jgi:hypothetical protein
LDSILTGQSAWVTNDMGRLFHFVRSLPVKNTDQQYIKNTSGGWVASVEVWPD